MFIVSRESVLVRTAPRLISCVPPISIVDGQKRSLLDAVVEDVGDAEGAAKDVDDESIEDMEEEGAELM